ncbi:anthranilate phosphoribosyltransferase [Candidatus Micrarchaeota archaeon]|nr:anthranilate phosphoribosyltransferase [Candidatus Micrarchaeota archaeon]
MNGLLEKIRRKEDLAVREAETLADSFLEPSLSGGQMKDFLLALNAKRVSVDELVGFAQSMRSHSVRISPRAEVMDTCGTGGDSSGTFNISTAAAFVAAACGVPVAKHGNKSVSSACGSADVLEALGADIRVTSEKTTDLIERIGFGFMFAPLYHPSMRHVAAVRKELGVKTIFNMLGPLTNPAGAKKQVIGAYGREAQDIMAKAAKALGTERAMVVHGNGMDEAYGETRLLEVTPSGIREFTIVAPEPKMSELKVSNAAESAKKVLNSLGGNCAESETVAFNASLALYAAGKAELGECAAMAEEAIESGRALGKMTKYIEASK